MATSKFTSSTPPKKPAALTPTFNKAAAGPPARPPNKPAPTLKPKGGPLNGPSPGGASRAAPAPVPPRNTLTPTFNAHSKGPKR